MPAEIKGSAHTYWCTYTHHCTGVSESLRVGSAHRGPVAFGTGPGMLAPGCFTDVKA